MGLITGQYILITALFSSCVLVNSDVVKRAPGSNTRANKPTGSETANTSGLQKLLQAVVALVGKVPILGSLLALVLQLVVNLLVTIELLASGSVSGLLVNLLPCQINATNGLQCSGSTNNNGGIAAALVQVINSLPSTLVPDLIKNLLVTLVTGLLEPILHGLLGL